MEATIRIKSQELTMELIEKVRNLFNNDETLEMTIAPVRRFEMVTNEPKEEYVMRVNKAIENLKC
jgi:plasmid maintenance system killer protein